MEFVFLIANIFSVFSAISAVNEGKEFNK